MRPIAPLKRRFAALLYESLLIGSVTILAGIAAGIINTAITRSAPTLAPAIPLLTSLVFVLAWWQYFRLNWQREGQTLPMRVWQIGLTDLAGSRPGKKQLLLRFAWACVLLVFTPCWRMPPCNTSAGTAKTPPSPRCFGGYCRGALPCLTRANSFCMTGWRVRS